jgi:hypothetical protein
MTSHIATSGIIDDDSLLEGEVVSSQTITSQSRTVETTTYTAERNGECETRVEQKVTIQSDGEPIDHDEALAQAIQVCYRSGSQTCLKFRCTVYSALMYNIDAM